MNLKFISMMLISIIALIVIIQFFSCVGVKSRKKVDGLYFYMSSQNRGLQVSEKKLLEGENKYRIFFNKKDYTPYVEDLIAKYPITFASESFLIFGEEKVIFKDNTLHCKQGILFVPGEHVISIIKASNIVFDEANQVIHLKNSHLEKLDLSNNKKDEKESDKMTIDLNKKSIT